MSAWPRLVIVVLVVGAALGLLIAGVPSRHHDRPLPIVPASTTTPSTSTPTTAPPATALP
jgi:hypothetical protein